MSFLNQHKKLLLGVAVGMLVAAYDPAGIFTTVRKYLPGKAA